MRTIVFITDAQTMRAILAHLREPTVPPRIAPAPDACLATDGCKLVSS